MRKGAGPAESGQTEVGFLFYELMNEIPLAVMDPLSGTRKEMAPVFEEATDL